jgi:hypothetical protein
MEKTATERGAHETFGSRSAAVIELMRVLDAVIAAGQSEGPRIEQPWH